jgi:hypothetical protein
MLLIGTVDYHQCYTMMPSDVCCCDRHILDSQPSFVQLCRTKLGGSNSSQRRTSRMRHDDSSYERRLGTEQWVSVLVPLRPSHHERNRQACTLVFIQYVSYVSHFLHLEYLPHVPKIYSAFEHLRGCNLSAAPSLLFASYVCQLISVCIPRPER